LPKPEPIQPGKYEFVPPVRKSSPIRTPDGIERPFTTSVELGYADN